MSEKLKHKDDPVDFPAPFCDYWLDRATAYQGTHPVPCDYCSKPIETGDRFFTVKADSMQPTKRGHLTHLKHAPVRDWVHDPARRVLQPWETDPAIAAPPGWEAWKRRKGINGD